MQFAGYHDIREISDRTASATCANGRKVILKRLDDDCLSDNELHPGIELRLQRIRELPVASVANLHGVERHGEHAFLVWDSLEGAPLEAIAPKLSSQDATRILREIHSIVQALHAMGIVHGAIHARNVIIDEFGRARLTHLSPLLFTDERRDHDAVRELSQQLLPSQALSIPSIRSEPDTRLRRRALAGAVMVAVAGAVLTLGIRAYVLHESEARAVPARNFEAVEQ